MNWAEYSRILLDKCKLKGVPYHACFELTPLCNFNCNMCYIHLTPEQAAKQGKLLSTQQWIDLANEVKKMGVISLEITGGEAVTRNDFPILYNTFKKLGFIINLRTNGYLIDGKLFETLKHNKPQRICITMYGASDQTYQKVCGIKDGFSVVTRNIIKLRNAGFDLNLTATITKDNVDDIYHLKNWCKDNALSITLCGLLLTPVRSARRSIDHLKIKHSDAECEITEDMEFMPHEIPDRDFYMNPFWMCRGFGAKLNITWDGRLTMCNSMPVIWKDPFLNGVSSAYYALYDELKTIKRPPECNDCKYIDFCAACPSQLYSATESVECTNDEICRMARRKYKLFLLKNSNVDKEKEQIVDSFYDKEEC